MKTFPLDYYMRTKITQNAEAIAKSMVKVDAIERCKPDFHKWGKYIYDVLEPEFERRASELEFSPVSHVMVVSAAGQKCVVEPYSARKGDFYVYFKKYRYEQEKPWPRRFCFEGLAATAPLTDSFGKGLVLYDNPVWHELRDEIVAYNTIVERFVERRRAFLSGVGKICARYDTLNEALAAWPALRGLLPEEWQRLTLSFDGTPKPLPEDVDVGSLTALITRAKLEV